MRPNALSHRRVSRRNSRSRSAFPVVALDGRCVPRRLTRYTLVWGAAIAGMVPGAAAAQQAERPPQFGLGASSALGLHAGGGILRHAALGLEVGGALDLGWIGTRHARVVAGVDYLSVRLDRPDSLGVRQTGPVYVFTIFADVNYLASVRHRVAPYAGVGFGVDAVGTTIQNAQIGALYNTNVFNLHGQAGALVRLTPRGRLKLELHAVTARVVRRVGFRIGYTVLYNELGPR